MMTIDITMFAALFSIGTLVLRCLEDLRDSASSMNN